MRVAHATGRRASALLLLSLACTRPAGTPVADDRADAGGPSEAVLVAAATLDEEETPIQGASPEAAYLSPPRGVHVVALPPLPYEHSEVWHGANALGAIVPGQGASGRDGQGTVYLATVDYASGTAYVAEWDLVTARPLRRVDLGLPAIDRALRMVRTGDTLHLTAAAYDDEVVYLRLTTDLRIEHTEVLGRVVNQEVMGLASDGRLTLILALGEVGQARGEYALPPLDDQYFAVTFDAAGRRVGQRSWSSHPGRPVPTPSATVLDGKVYMILEGPHDAQFLAEMAPDLTVLHEVRLPTLVAPNDGGRAFARSGALRPLGNHLALDTPRPPLRVALSTRGAVLGRFSSCPKTEMPGEPTIFLESTLWVGPVYVAMYAHMATGTTWLAWAEPGRLGPPPSADCPHAGLWREP